MYTSIGLTGNLDLLCDFTTEKLSGLLEEYLLDGDLPLSPKGMEFYNEAKGKDWWTNVLIVPARYTDKPKYTIGLGDSFVAGVRLWF